MNATVQVWHVNYKPCGKYAYCPQHGTIGGGGVPEHVALEHAVEHNILHHRGQVNEREIEDGRRTVYYAHCDECSWDGGNWATPSSAARSAREHNGQIHRHWGEVRMNINERKADPMRDKKTIDTAIEVAEARLAALLEERLALEKLPPEPSVDGSVVRFSLQFEPHGIRYYYAALKVGSLWWLTGKETRGKTWAEILEFASADWEVQDGGRRLRFILLNPGMDEIVLKARR